MSNYASRSSRHNLTTGKQGGAAGQYYHLTNAEYGGNWGAKNLTTTGSLGIGTTTPSGLLHVVSATFPVARIERTSTQTAAVRSTGQWLHTTNGNMADGFGTSLDIAIQDNAGVVNTIAGMLAVRSGADDTGDLRLQTYLAGAPSNVMSLTSAGKVGIGTTAPTSTLSVGGDIDLIGTYSNAIASGYQSFITGRVRTSSANKNDKTFMEFYGNSNGSLQIAAAYATAKIGFSTSNATASFTFSSTGTSGGVWYFAGLPSFDKYAAIPDTTFTVNASGATYTVIRSDFTNIYVKENNSAETAPGTLDSVDYSIEKMRITETGNVGFGTTTPAYKVDVAPGSSTNGIHISASGGGDYGAYINVPGTSEISFAGGARYNSYSSPNFVFLAKSTAASGVYTENGNVRLWGNTGLTAASTFNISTGLIMKGSTGNVGIGTVTPNTTLSLYNSNESTTQSDLTQALTKAGLNIITDYTENAYTPGIFWSTQDNNATKPKAGIYLKETGSGTNMYFGTSLSYATGITNDAMVIDPSGNVGIGTTAPEKQLSVGANLWQADVYGIQWNNGALTTTNGITGTAIWSQPFKGSSYKKVVINLANFTSAGTVLTFPTGFTNVPYTYGDAATVAIAVTTATTCTLTSVGAVAGNLIIEGY